ncbi:TlpA family protein disulfide reductase [Pseudotenacibaculum haliotis]|uniref:TlpA family protein disulfide reductase n=1 Tax=Pseudotenacibaculum haliotis TaxID=1862138 RepID=A0ABW5LS75_9FLAO
MKKILILLLFISSLAQAQYSVKGNLHPPKKYTWVLLYKVEGARQVFVKNTQIKQEVKQVDGKNLTYGTFEFEFPADAKTGAYRITYDLQQNGFVDFLFNKEDVELSFNPGDVEGTTVFSKSKENQLYKKFLADIATAQYKVDSLQVAYLKNPSQQLEGAYKKAVENISNVQNSYANSSKGTLVHHFIIATDRYNSPTVAKSSQEYLNGVISHFFDKIDFSSSYLYNSSFLIDRIADYVFYMNYSRDAKEQERLHKKAVDIAIGKVNDLTFKADVIEFLTSQFASIKNIELVDYLMTNHFEKLPKENQNLEFKKNIDEVMATAIGRVAPDFTWTENGKEMSLSQLKDGQSYLLIFYSTECSHCLREVPQIYEFMKGKTNTKVIAFAMETSDTMWKNYIKNLPGWHHALGLGKWENKTARMYQVNSTPTYFVLGMDKKIIANPEKIDDLKMILGSLN